MRRYVSLGLLVLLVGCAKHKVEKTEEVVSFRPRNPKPDAERKWIAVAEFPDKSGYGVGRLGTSASDMLMGQLVRCQQFKVFERERLAKIIEEQKLGGTGLVDASTAATVGKLCGVKYLVIGAVTNFGINIRGSDFGVGSTKKQVATSEVEVRLVDTETGQIMFAETGRGEASRSSTKVVGVGARAGYDETLAGDSLKASIAKFLDNLIDVAAGP